MYTLGTTRGFDGRKWRHHVNRTTTDASPQSLPDSNIYTNQYSWPLVYQSGTVYVKLISSTHVVLIYALVFKQRHCNTMVSIDLYTETVRWHSVHLDSSKCLGTNQSDIMMHVRFNVALGAGPESRCGAVSITAKGLPLSSLMTIQQVHGINLQRVISSVMPTDDTVVNVSYSKTILLVLLPQFLQWNTVSIPAILVLPR